MKRMAVAAGIALALTACQETDRSTRHLAPIPPATLSLMAAKGMQQGDPILIRAYKKESELEVWKRGKDGRYALLKTYPICRWSGQLGPKVKEGDRQAPEGFYAITPAQLNPNSSYYLSFDTGFPNAYDRAHGRTGSLLMVHGSCSSRGCFAMTDEGIAEVYAIAREAFAGGQRAFQFQSFPFRMTPQNLAQHRFDPNIGFWKNLKEGADYFEVRREEPAVAVCGGRYAFGEPGAVNACVPSRDPELVAKRERDEQQIAELAASGTPAVRLVYQDGGQHQSFRQTVVSEAGVPADSAAAARLGDVSRPEALAQGPQEIAIDRSGRPQLQSQPTLAYTSGRAAAAPLPSKAAAQGATARPRPAPAVEESVLAASAPEPEPLYRRMLSGIGSLFTP